MTITLEKKYLEVLFQALRGTEGVLSLTEARIRDLFFKQVTPALETFYEHRKKIYDQFCTKKEDGTPDIKNDLYTFPKDVVPEMQKEIDTLLAETVELTVPFADSIKKIIERTEYKPKQGEAEMIDEIVAKIK